MQRFTCYSCKKQMPGQTLRTMVHVREHHALVMLMCPDCQRKYGDHNPNYYYAEVAPAVVVLEAQKLRDKRKLG